MQPRLREDAEKERETPAAAVGEASGARRELLIWLRNLAVAAVAGLFLALTGAFETANYALLQRLLYWIPLMLGGALIADGVAKLVSKLLDPGTNRWAFGAILSLAISLPIMLLVWAYTNLLFDNRFDIAALPYYFGGVLLISAAMTAIMLLVNQPGRVTHAAPSGATAPPVRFVERLPPKLKGALIYAVSAEDHYLRLHTSKGGDLILMRLADAIAELEGLEGAQTHRSWWVAKDAVESARREGDRVVLVLKGGAEAPVSRPNIKPLREAGWF